MSGASSGSGTSSAVSVPGWATVPGQLTAEVTANGSVPEASSKRLPGIGLELLGLIVEHGTNTVLAACVRITRAHDEAVVSHEVELPASLARATQSADDWAKHGRINPSPDRARVASRWLSSALEVLQAPTEHVVSRPTWDGDQLLLPSNMAEAAESDEEIARAAWQEIVKTLNDRELDAAAIVIGASVISPQLTRLGRPGFTVHARGDSSTGKTTTAKMAAAVWSRPPATGTEPNWNMTANYLTKTLEQRGLMPVLFDETGTVGQRDREQFLVNAVMTISTGHERGRLTSSAEKVETNPWTLAVISTGEESILDRARVGASARVVELAGPFLPDAKTADGLRDLAEDHYGWPGRWLRRNGWKIPTIPPLRSESRIANRLAPTVAACAAGFAELALRVGIEVNAEWLGRRVLARLADELSERGETAGERFWAALQHDVASNALLYPPLAGTGVFSADAIGRDLRGVKRDGWTWVFVPAAKEIARAVDCDLKAALKELEAGGRHQVLTQTRGRQERVSVNGAQVASYVFDLGDAELPAEPDATNTNVLPAVPVAAVPVGEESF